MSTIQPEMPSAGGAKGAGGPEGDASKFKPIDKNTMQPLQTEMKAMMAHVKVLLKDASGEDATKMKGLLAKLEGLKNETDPAKLKRQLTELQESNPVMKAGMAEVKSQDGVTSKDIFLLLNSSVQSGALTIKEQMVFTKKLEDIQDQVKNGTMSPEDGQKAMDKLYSDIKTQVESSTT